MTSSAITLVRSARPNPRGRHASVADHSGVECQRDGSDQGPRMEARDGALTLNWSPCLVRGCPPLASLAATQAPNIGEVQAGKEKRNAATDEYGRAGPPLGNPWRQVEAPNPCAPLSFRPDWPSHEGSSPEWGETACQAPVGTTRARSRPCRDAPSFSSFLRNLMSRESLQAHVLTKIWASSQRSKYRHYDEYTLESHYSLRREC